MISFLTVFLNVRIKIGLESPFDLGYGFYCSRIGKDVRNFAVVRFCLDMLIKLNIVNWLRVVGSIANQK